MARVCIMQGMPLAPSPPPPTYGSTSLLFGPGDFLEDSFFSDVKPGARDARWAQRCHALDLQQARLASAQQRLQYLIMPQCEAAAKVRMSTARAAAAGKCAMVPAWYLPCSGGIFFSRSDRRTPPPCPPPPRSCCQMCADSSVLCYERRGEEGMSTRWPWQPG